MSGALQILLPEWVRLKLRALRSFWFPFEPLPQQNPPGVLLNPGFALYRRLFCFFGFCSAPGAPGAEVGISPSITSSSSQPRPERKLSHGCGCQNVLVPLVNVKNRWQMDVHPPQNGAIGYAPWPCEPR